MPIAIVFVQVMLGILTVLSSVNIVPGTWSVFEWLAELHQLFGMLLLLSLVSLLFAVRSTKKA
jgi:cytochrome c oxidase assembly protein subunit 15